MRADTAFVRRFLKNRELVKTIPQTQAGVRAAREKRDQAGKALEQAEHALRHAAAADSNAGMALQEIVSSSSSRFLVEDLGRPERYRLLCEEPVAAPVAQ